AGAREVHMRVSSAPIISPCYYGIDTPRKEELIAATMDHESLAHHLGVDTLGYLSLEGMLSVMPTGPSGYCHACFSGKYPTSIPENPELLRAGGGRRVAAGVT
ncbi:MAG: amidophosphoribosyltransferase, partial [Gemmatimonadaceae bacterium]